MHIYIYIYIYIYILSITLLQQSHIHMLSIGLYMLPKSILHIEQLCDVICLKAVVLPGGKTMKRLHGNGRKSTSFLLTSPALIIEHLQY